MFVTTISYLYDKCFSFLFINHQTFPFPHIFAGCKIQKASNNPLTFIRIVRCLYLSNRPYYIYLTLCLSLFFFKNRRFSVVLICVISPSWTVITIEPYSNSRKLSEREFIFSSSNFTRLAPPFAILNPLHLAQS